MSTVDKKLTTLINIFLQVTLNLTFRNKNHSGRENGSSTECFVVLRFHLSSSLPSGASIVPIISLPFRVTYCTNSTVSSRSEDTKFELKVNDNISSLCKGEEMRKSTIMNIGESTCASCIRESRVGDVTVYVLESPGLLGIGGKVWDSTFVLVDFLRRKGLAFISGKRVVELGSGTGVSGTYVTGCLL